MKENLAIMLIDDDEDDTQLFIESVKEVDESIRCIAEQDGLTALKYLEDENNEVPDYIFLDLRMPKMSGQKVLEEIRKKERLMDVPVFVYSTSTDQKDITTMEAEGAVMFISKPRDPEEIYYLLSHILGEKWHS